MTENRSVMGRGLSAKGQQRTLGGDENVLCPDGGSEHVMIYSCQKSSNYTLKE